MAVSQCTRLNFTQSFEFVANSFFKLVLWENKGKKSDKFSLHIFYAT